jgi:hypothetical protein
VKADSEAAVVAAEIAVNAVVVAAAAGSDGSLRR